MVDLASGPIGPETVYDVAFTAGALAFTLKYTGAQGSLAVTGSISAAQLLASLAAKVTNPLEKEAIAIVQGVIAAIP